MGRPASVGIWGSVICFGGLMPLGPESRMPQWFVTRICKGRERP